MSAVAIDDLRVVVVRAFMSLSTESVIRRASSMMSWYAAA